MAQIYMTTVDVNFAGLTVDSNGVVKTSVTTSFSSKVMTASAALQGWGVGFGRADRHFRAAGAWVTDVSFLDNMVKFSARLQLEDNSNNRLELSDATMTVNVIAQCE